MRIAVTWPRPRRDRWKLGQQHPDRYPDLSDGLLFLEDQGFRIGIEDSLGLPLNPMARQHEFYSGLDPLRAARVFARRRRYDAIIAIGCASGFYPVQIRRLLGLKIPIVSIDPALSHDYPRRKRLQDVVLPRVDKVVVFGSVQLDYLREEYGDRVDAVFIPHRADTEFFRPDPTDPQGSGQERLVLSVGNDISRDFDTLVEAVQIGRLREDLGAQCLIHTTRPVELTAPGISVRREQISFVDLRRSYQASSVFVLPLRDTIHAGGINSLLEAMSMSRPVVVTRSRGIIDYVADGENALVVDPGDAAGMARAIRRLLENPEEAGRLGENARRSIVENNRNPLYAQRLGSILREVIQPAGRSSRSIPPEAVASRDVPGQQTL
jgi:glycosyltransferase involved in cell wall biosynthesis